MTHDALRAALVDARVPRYTSFPPANRFAATIGPEDACHWMESVPAGALLSLYVHVPFCRRLCWFCACRTQGTTSDAPLDRYLDHLEREIAFVSRTLPGDATVSALHLGGGTPTILSPGRIDRLGNMLHGAFALSRDADVSVEIDPSECDLARLDALMALGMTRVSVGVQDFDPQVQEAIGRRQSVAETAAIVDGARARGIRSLNVDLVYGLPHQGEARLAATLDAVLALRPDRLALFGYAHVPWMAKRQRMIPEAALPGPEARLGLADLARRLLTGAGYVPVGIDHFAQPGDAMAKAAAEGTLSRNFQGYTTDRAATLIGLGPSSISRFEQGFVQNAPATGAWQQLVAAGRPATVRGHALSGMDRLFGGIIEALMCRGAVDLDAAAEAAGLKSGALRIRAARALSDLPGIGTLDGGVLTARDPGVQRLLASYFDPGFVPEADTYSQAS